MAYTLAMATGKGIEVAKDGVATVGMTEARALLTSLIREVRYGGKVGAFTERGARQAYLVTPDFYERAAEDQTGGDVRGDLRPTPHLPGRNHQRSTRRRAGGARHGVGHRRPCLRREPRRRATRSRRGRGAGRAP